MTAQPFYKLSAINFTRGNLKNDLFLFVYIGYDLVTVEYQKNFHCCMAKPFIAIHERVIPNNPKGER